MKNTNPPIPYSDDTETIPADETDNIRRVAEAVKQMLVQGTEKSGKFRADVHVKTHGFARAELEVLPDLPEELAQGLFARPAAYPAVVRFSNSASVPLPDAVPDGRGMAIKIFDVTGESIPTDDQASPSQDFVMINHPVFFAANAKDFLRLEKVVLATETNPLAATGALTGGEWNPLNWHWREIMKITQIAGKPPAHPVNNTYFSMSPIRFGNYVAKCRVKPAGDRSDSYLQMLARLATESDAMKLALEETLRAGPVTFEFQAQLRTSEQSMPIEDATVEWPESESPYRTVAQLTLMQQDIEPLRDHKEFQNLSFNVWHALVAHQPLGGINRVRRQVYPMSATWRRQR